MVPNGLYMQSYLMGTVHDYKRVYEVLDEVKAEFRANEYSLIGQNCNHFSQAFCSRLLEKDIPSYINRLARMGSWVSFILPYSLKSLNPIPSGGAANNSGRPRASF